MKKIEKGLLLITMLIFLIASCDKKEPDLVDPTPNPPAPPTEPTFDNYLKIGDKTYQLLLGQLTNWGTDETHDGYRFELELVNISGEQKITFTLYSANVLALDNATYNYTTDEHPEIHTVGSGFWLVREDGETLGSGDI